MSDEQISGLRDFMRQLNRRRVFRVAAVYVVAGFALIQAADPLLDMAGAPPWVAKVVLVLVALGFPAALALAWAFDITPEGITRTPPDGAVAPRAQPRAGPIAVVGAVAVLAVAGGAWALLGRSGEAPLDPEAVVVLPFRVAGDPSTGYLREGMVDLFAAALNGDTAARAVDPRTAMAAWRRAVGDDAVDLPPEQAFRVARTLGAGRVVLGEVVETARQLTLNVTLYDVARADVLQRVSHAGPADSLPALVDYLIGQMLAREAGLAQHQLTSLTTRSLPALRAYLEGRRNYRLGRYSEAARQLEEALRQDSTFALAAIQLWLVNGWGDLTTQPGTAARTLRLAWPARDRLSEPDRLFLEAIAGPRYPDPTPRTELRVARERALDAAPDRPEALFLLGTWHRGGVLRDEPGAQERAAEYWRRALMLDSTYAAPLQNLLRVALVRGDTATVGRLVQRYLSADSTSEVSDLFRWMHAVASGDERAILTVRERMPSMHPTSLGWIALAAMNHGLDMDGAEIALDALRATARSQRERINMFWREVEFLVNRGRLREMIVLNDSMFAGEFAPQIVTQSGISRDRVLQIGEAVNRAQAVLFAGADTTGLGAAALTLDSIYQNPPAMSAEPADARGFIAFFSCQAGHALIALGRLAAARKAAARIPDVLSDDMPNAARRASTACAATLNAAIAVAEGRPDARDLAQNADTLLFALPRMPRNQNQLLLARVYDALGDPAAGARILRRRELNNPDFFLATLLREEGRLAARAGDRDGAIRAYRHYLTLRTQPDPELEPEVRRVREELAALAGEGR